MLVLTRREGEAVCIGDGDFPVVIEVIRTGQGAIKIGITAPKEVPIHRREVWERVREQMRGKQDE